MNTFSDEPVLIKTPRRFSAKHWIAIVATLVLAGGVLYIPFDESRMETLAHHAPRGPKSGTLYNITIGGTPHTLELTWVQKNFAVILQPPPPAAATLSLSSRAGTETLEWNDKLAAFGPGRVEIDPMSHYKLELKLTAAGRMLWQDSLWAYGYHDTHGHSH